MAPWSQAASKDPLSQGVSLSPVQHEEYFGIRIVDRPRSQSGVHAPSDPMMLWMAGMCQLPDERSLERDIFWQGLFQGLGSEEQAHNTVLGWLNQFAADQRTRGGT